MDGIQSNNDGLREFNIISEKRNNYSSCPAASTYIYQNTPISQGTFEALIKNQQFTFNAIEKKRLINMLDFENFQKKEDYKEQIKALRDSCPTSLYWDAKGELKIEISSLGGLLMADKLCELQKVETKVALYKPMNMVILGDSKYVVSYKINGSNCQVSLPMEDYGKGKLIRKMKYSGISFYISQRKLNEIASDFEAFILKEAKEIIVPLAYGWNFYNEKWYFASEKTMIWEDIRNGRYK